MEETTCTANECEQPPHARGLCARHYQAARRDGLLSEYRSTARPSIEERFWAKVQKSDGCWEWQAGKSNGYGAFYDTRPSPRKQIPAHRFAYELANGTIPDGMLIDHRCFNRACVNPAHLRLASFKQNREHLAGAMKNSASGIRNVKKYPSREGCWSASITHNKKTIWLGAFDSIEKASQAADDARRQWFTHADSSAA